jgi:nicotinamide-nucleotide adenylyltransferase
MPERGMFLGRFQPPHLGHLSVLEEVAAEVDRLVIVVGSSQYSHTLENPFTAGERVWMLDESLVERDIHATIIPVPDIHRNSLWVSHVETFCPPFDVCYMNNPLPKRLFREAGYEVREFELVDRERYEATQIRQLMQEDGDAWTELVPEPVADIVEEIDGIRRLNEITSSDAANGTEESMTEPPYKKD